MAYPLAYRPPLDFDALVVQVGFDLLFVLLDVAHCRSSVYDWTCRAAARAVKNGWTRPLIRRSREADAGEATGSLQGTPMPVPHEVSEISEVMTLARHDTFALVSALVPGLPQTLLVQLMASKFCRRRSFSLYVVYREGGMTFEAATPFQMGNPTAELDKVLTEFVLGPNFAGAVLYPMQASVRRHFRGRR